MASTSGNITETGLLFACLFSTVIFISIAWWPSFFGIFLSGFFWARSRKDIRTANSIATINELKRLCGIDQRIVS